MRVIHILKEFSAGGVEKWLKDLSYTTQDELNFYLETSEEKLFDKTLNDDTSKITYGSGRPRILHYTFDLYVIIKKYKPDVVHSHIHLASGIVLLVAFLAGTKVRVAHCHNDKRSEFMASNIFKRLYRWFMMCLIFIFSNAKISVSKSCSGSMFFSQRNVKIIPCGVSFKPSRCISREELGIEIESSVICHVGRFVPQKNHTFLIELFSEICKQNTNSVLVLVGEGPEKPACYDLVNSKNLSDKVIFLEPIENINDFLCDIPDLFLLPSNFEGLGLVAIESQAHGIPTIISEKVPNEVICAPFCKQISLSEKEVWVDTVLNILKDNKRFAIESGVDEFKIEINTKNLAQVYYGTY